MAGDSRFRRESVELRGFLQDVNLAAEQGAILTIPSISRELGGSSSVGRASAFQAECREFEPRLPLQIKIEWLLNDNSGCAIWSWAHVAQSVERFLGKEEVHRFDSGRGLQIFL